MKKRKDGCTFCRDDFPYGYQLISDAPEYWLFIMNIEPQCDFHCLLVLKAKIVDRIGHISHIGDRRVPDKAASELGLLIKRASITIKQSDPTIDKILLASLNTGKTSKHMHVHLIPKKKGEKVKRVNDPKDDGGGLFFLARKEIVVDTFQEFINSTTREKSNALIKRISRATKTQVEKNAKILRQNFAKMWKSDH